MHDEVKCSGDVLVEFLNDADEVIEHYALKNKVVASGRAFLAQLLSTDQDAQFRPADMRYMAMGSSTVASEDTHTALLAETARVQIEQRPQNGVQVTFVTTFAAGLGTGNVGEFGIFNSAGVMLARVYSSTAQPKASNTSIRVTWAITLS